MTIKTLDDKKKLKLLIAEYQQRGREIPQEILQEVAEESMDKKVLWRNAPGGYFYRSDGREYIPNERMGAFLQSRAMYSGMFAGRGSGKSCVGSIKALKKIQQGQPGAVYNPSFTDFADSTWPEFREWIPWGCVAPAHKHRQNPEWRPSKPFTMVFLVGGKQVPVICKGLKNPNAARGPNMNWLWYDEGGSDRDGASWQIAIPSVRIGPDPQAWVTSTPKGKTHWMYKFFVEQDMPQDVIMMLEKLDLDRPLFETFYSTIFDNQDNLDPAFLARMLAAYPAGFLRRQEIMGEFVMEEGAVGGPAAEALRNNLIPRMPIDIDKKVRFWDLAATEKKVVGGKTVNDPDETVGTLAGWNKENEEMYLEDQQFGHWSWDDILKNIVRVADMDGPYVRIVVEQEPAAGGKNQIAAIRNHVRDNLPEWPSVTGWNPKDCGDRVMGANYWFASAVQSKVFMIHGAWNEETLRQIEDFPVAKHDDRVTSITGARYSLAPVRKWKKMKFLHMGKLGHKEDEKED